MKNKFIYKLKNKIKINIKGKNIERFLKRIIKNNIEIINLNQIKYNEINMIIYLKDLKKVEELKTIYELEIKKYYGIKDIINRILINKYLLIFIVVGISLIIVLSNIIFEVEVIHSNKNIRYILKEELKNNGIDKYKIKKTYKQKQNIKKIILQKYKDKIEWLEIEEKGTKYIIKVEERIINKEHQINEINDIVAKKNGIIMSVEAINGEIIRNKGDYVSKGDVIVTGNIYLNDKLQNQTKASAKVYAEVWYTTKLKLPYKYENIELTNNKKNVYTIKIMNKYYELLNFKKYKTKQINDKTIFKNNILPLYFIKQTQYETKETKKIYNKNELKEEIIKQSKKELLKKLDKDSSIINYKILNENINQKYIELKIFFTIKENITDYKKIEKIDIDNQKEKNE